jgi:hypothetical protein
MLRTKMSSVTKLGVLTIQGTEFPVARATFSAQGPRLDLSVDAEVPQVPRGHPYYLLRPRLYIEFGPFALSPDAMMASFELLPPGADEDEWLFCLYVHEHELVSECKFTLAREGEGYALSAAGHATVMGDPVAFSVQTSLAGQFAGSDSAPKN